MTAAMSSFRPSGVSYRNTAGGRESEEEIQEDEDMQRLRQMNGKLEELGSTLANAASDMSQMVQNASTMAKIIELLGGEGGGGATDSPRVSYKPTYDTISASDVQNQAEARVRENEQRIKDQKEQIDNAKQKMDHGADDKKEITANDRSTSKDHSTNVTAAIVL